MNWKFLAATTATAATFIFSGCAGGASAIKPITEAETTMGIANDAKLAPAQTTNAKASLDKAQKLLQEGEQEEAAALADQSTLEFKLALATVERDEAKKEDERVEKELRTDVERKLIYQSILDQETKKEGAR